MSQDTYRAGLVGCGWAGRAYAKTFRDHARTEFVAATELDSSTRRAFADEFPSVEMYDEHERMLEFEDLDVVAICTWPSTHARITVDTAEASVDGIVCEKPMCRSLGEADDMLDAADRNDAKLVVGTQRRHTAAHEKARELIADGEIGEPRSVITSTNSGMFNWGTHMIDLSRYLLGDPELKWVIGQIERKTERYERGIPIEDLSSGQICFADGARLTFECDMPEPQFSERGQPIEVLGSEGTLSLALGSEVTVLNEDGRATYAPDNERPEHAALLDELFDWLEGERDDHRCSGQQARATMEIIMSIYESARKNEVTVAPLETRANPLHVMLENGELPPEHPGKYDIRIPYASLDDA